MSWDHFGDTVLSGFLALLFSLHVVGHKTKFVAAVCITL